MNINEPPQLSTPSGGSDISIVPRSHTCAYIHEHVYTFAMNIVSIGLGTRLHVYVLCNL